LRIPLLLRPRAPAARNVQPLRLPFQIATEDSISSALAAENIRCAAAEQDPNALQNS